MSSEGAAAAGSGSRVAGIVGALSALEDDLDSLDGGMDEMGRRLAAGAQSEIDAMVAHTRESASKEAERMIAKARADAESEAAGIAQAGEARMGELRASIDSGMDRAVDHVVSSVLRA